MSTAQKAAAAALVLFLCFLEGARPAAAQITATGSYILHQGVADVLGTPGDADHFGETVATGDFDGDGSDDLAVGIPGELVGSSDAAGAVQIFPGGVAGFSGEGDRIFHQDTAGVSGVAEANDRFGEVLAVGDFDGDGFDDLAIGAPGEDVGDASGAGAVWILFGSPNGLSTTGQRSFDQQLHSPWDESAEAGDGYGSALAAGDFDGDGDDDLAVGVPGEDLFFGPTDAGTVHLYSGPDFAVQNILRQGELDPTTDAWDITPADVAETSDRYGSALAAGDFDGDERDDLAIGAPGEDLSGLNSAGIVEVLFGSDRILLLEPDRSVLLHQDRSGSPGAVEANDLFGAELAVGDFDNDGIDDLAVGIASEALGGLSDAGGVAIFLGPFPEFSSVSGQFFSQDDPIGVAGAAETGDHFAAELAVGDFDGDGIDDLALGVPDENIGSATNAGSFHVLYGGASGLGSSGNQAFDQESPGVPNSNDTNDHFGGALSAGDFDGDGDVDLAVGSAGEEIAGEAADHGVVFIFEAN